MSHSYGLSMAGFGYLQEVVTLNDQTLVRLYCLSPTHSSEQRSEMVVFNCSVTDETIKAKLARYQVDMEQSRAVIVKFAAQYLETTGFHHCMAKNDPDHILTISAKLTAIEVSSPFRRKHVKPTF
jgi:hypothetical protein